MDEETRAKYLDECPAFGADEQGQVGFDPEASECVMCQEKDPAMAEACRTDVREVLEGAEEVGGSPESDDLSEEVSEDTENADTAAQAVSGLVDAATQIEWQGEGHYVLIEDDDQRILRRTESEDADGIDLAAVPDGLEVVTNEKPEPDCIANLRPNPKPKAKKTSRMDVLWKLMTDGEPRTKKQYAEAIAAKLPRFTAKQLMGFVGDHFRFCVGAGFMVKDEDGTYRKA